MTRLRIAMVKTFKSSLGTVRTSSYFFADTILRE
jgi:hypothetical protein